MELMFRYTRNLNMPDEVKQSLFMDRMVNVRLQLLQEKSIQPALLIGFHDAAGKVVNEDTRAHFAANYLVMSKNLSIQNLRLGLHAGYAFDLFGLETKAYDGIFAGINLMPLGDERLELILEHDSLRPNVAARVLLFKHLGLTAGLWTMEEVSVGGNLRIRLKND
jgi:hypothetical protein